MTDIRNTLDAHINISKISLDVTTDYLLKEDIPWVSELLDEIEEETDREDPEYRKGRIEIELSLKRKSEVPFSDHVLIKGRVRTSFQMPCVRCLKLTGQKINEPFTAAFLHKHFEKEPEYEEADDIFTENEAFDLYFHDKGKIDIKEMLHEQIYIHVDSFLLHDKDCKGLCSQCGVDLNTETCKCQK